jgi:hypothetical protein
VSPHHLRGETDPFSQTLCFVLLRISGVAQYPKPLSKKVETKTAARNHLMIRKQRLILKINHHHQIQGIGPQASSGLTVFPPVSNSP